MLFIHKLKGAIYLKKILKFFSYGIIVTVFGLFGFYKYITSQPVVVHASYAEIMSPEKAAAQADNIVIGRVVKNLGTYQENMFPYTDFEIQVEKNLKGVINGNFVFAQEGGYDKDIGKTIQFDNYKIFTPGERYLLFLKKYPDEPAKYYSVGSGPTVYKLEGDKALNMFLQRSLTLDGLEKIIAQHK
ncbi:hypothetical protein ULO1_24890 [Carboxydocella sp. ULO1]|nr:hypothetical protein ULO1_24890 [Carboxydocella sp. ULO1]